MKFSVSSYSYSSLINSGEKSLFDCISVAKETGFDGIEFIDFDVPESMSLPEYAERVKEKCQSEGLEISAYTIGADFLYGSGGDLDGEIRRLKSQVDIASLLGTDKMRHDATRGYDRGDRGFKSFDDALPRIIRGCREVTEYAASKGVKTMTENHGFFSQDSQRVEKIVNGVKNDNFGLLIDIGNFMCADEDPIEAVGRLAPYAFHVHAKDFHKKSGNAPFFCDGFFKTRGGSYLRGAVIGHGDVPVYQCLSTLISNGYDGYVTVEFEGIESSITGTSFGLNTLKRMCASIG
ncbi:MAG: sugar phosphate isomerase/epimerase [Clostridiales bacterium]|nr:sugar phosphate isomerase/epimerase [Clostridiales bacterium]